MSGIDDESVRRVIINLLGVLSVQSVVVHFTDIDGNARDVVVPGPEFLQDVLLRAERR